MHKRLIAAAVLALVLLAAGLAWYFQFQPFRVEIHNGTQPLMGVRVEAGGQVVSLARIEGDATQHVELVPRSDSSLRLRYTTPDGELVSCLLHVAIGEGTRGTVVVAIEGDHCRLIDDGTHG
jgi:hypothetical protein